MEFQMFLAFVLLLCVGCSRSEDSEELAKVVSQLQAQVVALQEARIQDQAKIRVLQDKLHHHFETSDDNTSQDSERSTIFDTDDFSIVGSSTPSPVLTTTEGIKLSKQQHERNTQQVGNSKLSENIQLFDRERYSLGHLEEQLYKLKTDLSEVVKVKEREIEVTEDIADFRLEADSLREELQRIKQELEALRTEREDDISAAKQARDGQVATDWLRKTVEELRHEMTELAAAVNVSVAIGQRQKVEANIALAKSDLADLRHRLDNVHVAQERDSAYVTQLRDDLVELRTRTQHIAAGHITLTHEVDAMKEDLQEITRKSMSENKMNSRIYGSLQHRAEKMHHGSRQELADESTHHHIRHHGHWQSEIDALQKSVGNLESQQEKLLRDIRGLKQNHSIVALKMESVESASDHLVNKSSHMTADQSAMSREIEYVKRQMEATERQAHDIRSTVNNITESGIKKLHASTIQLFQTLETLESNYDKTISDLRKEMSKMEFNLAQAQSTVKELREDQGDHEERLKSAKNELRRMQMEVKRDRFRILAVQSEVANRTLQEVKRNSMYDARELRMGTLENRITSLSAAIDEERQEVEILRRQMREKAEASELSKWQRTQDRLRQIVLNVTDVIPKLQKEEEHVEGEIQKFVHGLPKDCSRIDLNMDHLQKHKSAAYLIQYPVQPSSTSHAKALRVFCDMETSSGNWTVIQRRKDGGQDFNQNWHHYKEGFGDVTGDFWLGNEVIHLLTTNDDYALRIDLWDSAGRYKYAEYTTFRVLQESDGYRLAVAGYSGNASDALGYHNGMAFSTPDRDNDASLATHCGQFYGSGWWYNHCQYVNINGRYSTGVTWYDIDGQEWSELTRVEMKIKPVGLMSNKKLTPSSR